MENTMTMQKLALAVACAASLTSAAFAEPFNAGIGGVCSNKDDLSFTGTPAAVAPGGALRIYCQVSGQSSFGSYHANILAELQVTGACTANGAPGFQTKAVGYIAILTYKNGEQLFLQGTTGEECLTPPGVPAPGKATLSVIGGTGRFRDATGTLSHDFNPIALAFSAIPGGGFISAFSGTYEGTVVLK
jgi:hypothetical protein